MLEQLSDKLESVFKRLKGQGKISEANIQESLREIRVAFLAADVHYKTTKDFIEAIKTRALGEEVLKSITPGQQIVKITYDALCELLGEKAWEPTYQGQNPYQILVMGLQGSGKTTFCGKLGLYLRNKKKKNPLLVACDVYRPAAIQQLQTLGKALSIPVFAEEGKNPVDIAQNAKRFALDNNHDLVIYDTAGRLQIDDELMLELEKIQSSLKPQEKFLVADAMTGQNAVQVAEQFHKRLDISGVVLTKLDGDSRGGAALSIKSVTGKPIIYAGVGEKPDALELFHPDRIASRILGMGDIVSLVEKAQDNIDEKTAKSLGSRLRQNKFDLNDFLSQLKQIKKMGSFTDLMGMIPGFSKMKGAKVDERQLVYVEAILSSMTSYERSHPKIIDGRRRKRIALGSGTQVQKVNQVLEQFSQMQKMMKKMMSGGAKGHQMKQMMKSAFGGGMPGM